MRVGYRLGYRLPYVSGYGYGDSSSTPFVPSQLADLNFWYAENTRSGLTLPNSLTPGTGDASLIPSHYSSSGSSLFSYADSGALDVGTTSLTLAGWFKVKSKTTQGYMAGKPVNGSTQGRWHLTFAATTGKIRFGANSTGGLAFTEGTTDVTSGWHFYIGEVDLATSNVRVFCDNVQEGSDVAFTGTFPAMAAQYEFYIGGGNSSDGSSTSLLASMDACDVIVFHRLLTPTEKTTLFNRGYIAGSAGYWPLAGGQCVYDVSGNNRHLTAIGGNGVNKAYNVSGSRYMLDNGFTMYDRGYDRKIYVPLRQDGTAITAIGLTVDYKQTAEGTHAGSATNLNLADVMIQLGDSWDRSSTDAFTWEARHAKTYYDATSAATKKQWHSSEMNNLMFQAWSNADYKGINFCKLSDFSYKSRKVLKEIGSYATDQYVSWGDVMTYAGDYKVTDTYENDYIQWKYFTESIISIRGDKWLKWENAATDKLHLSLDAGVTYPYVINSPFNGQSPTFAHIFANGNILVAGINTLYLSINNLTSIAATTVKDIAGADYSGGDNCFNAFIRGANFTVAGVEILVWGCYRNTVSDGDEDINVWISNDNGVNVKSIYKADITDPPNLPARHIHCVNYREADGSLWVTTGDNNDPAENEANILRGVVNYTTLEATWEKLHGDVGAGMTYELGPIGFEGDSIVTTDENTLSATNNGIWTCPIADLGDSDNFEVIYPWLPLGNGIMNLPDMIVALGTTANTNTLVITGSGIANIHGNKIYGVPENLISFNLATDGDGWYLLHPRVAAEGVAYLLAGDSLLVKIK